MDKSYLNNLTGFHSVVTGSVNEGMAVKSLGFSNRKFQQHRS